MIFEQVELLHEHLRKDTIDFDFVETHSRFVAELARQARLDRTLSRTVLSAYCPHETPSAA